ncbi:hypothetical protein C8J55DRAFT_525895 [Lentinula edodes]|uniref:Uncharacterized protein n=1 Tax=Lentinula lateritia TaxID=40482 RepID=A0A9W8ZV82_9AGAR|nr:hypothetical protein C8J55DRAFT_525895 [Lentinula edodes]
MMIQSYHTLPHSELIVWSLIIDFSLVYRLSSCCGSCGCWRLTVERIGYMFFRWADRTHTIHTKVSRCTMWRRIGVLVEMHRVPDTLILCCMFSFFLRALAY